MKSNTKIELSKYLLPILALILSVIYMQNFNLVSYVEAYEDYQDFEYYILGDEVVISAYYGDAANVVVPDEIEGYPVKYMDANVFNYCDTLVTVTLPKELQFIDGSFFDGANKLTTINIQEDVSLISPDAFNGCIKLETINVSANNQTYSSEDGVLFNKDKTQLIYYPISKPEPEYIMPNTVKELNDGAFKSCRYLSNVTVSDNVTQISSNCFSECNALTNVSLPDNLQSINRSAFEGCKVLKKITFPNKLKEIGDYAFSKCDQLDDFILPDSLETIGSNSFEYCVSINYLTIPNSVTSMGVKAFYFCIGLVEVNLSDNLIAIKESAFEHCTRLESITIPKNVQNIHNKAFLSCTCLEKIEFNDGLVSIGEKAFSECLYLKDLRIPDSVRSINNRAFYNCWELERISIPAGTTFIATDAFNTSQGQNAHYAIMYGESDSYAHSYAKEHGIAFCDQALYDNPPTDVDVKYNFSMYNIEGSLSDYIYYQVYFRHEDTIRQFAVHCDGSPNLPPEVYHMIKKTILLQNSVTNTNIVPQYIAYYDTEKQENIFQVLLEATIEAPNDGDSGYFTIEFNGFYDHFQINTVDYDTTIKEIFINTFDQGLSGSSNNILEGDGTILYRKNLLSAGLDNGTIYSIDIRNVNNESMTIDNGLLDLSKIYIPDTVNMQKFDPVTTDINGVLGTDHPKDIKSNTVCLFKFIINGNQLGLQLQTVRKGDAWFTIRCGDFSQQFHIEIENPFNYPERIELDKESVVIKTGSTETFTATVTPNNPNYISAKWVVLDSETGKDRPNDYTIKENGNTANISFHKEGTYVVYKSYKISNNPSDWDFISNVCTVTVTDTGVSNPIPTQKPTPLPENSYYRGDTDFNENVDAIDALAVLKHAAKIEQLDDFSLTIADMDKNENLNAIDSLEILKVAARISEKTIITFHYAE